MRITILVVLVVLVAGGAFFAGRWHGMRVAQPGARPSVVLTEEMVILTAGGEPSGRLPSGTKLYVVPDPWGDRTSLFALYLRTEASDEHPLRRSQEMPAHDLEYDSYWLKSLRWLTSRRNHKE